MKREDLVRKLARLLGDEGLAAAGVDATAVRTKEDLPVWLQRLVDAAETLSLPEVPPVVSQDLHRLFDVTTFVEGQRAELVDDTRRSGELVGVRGADPSQGWSMTYTSSVADVVLDVWPQEDGSLDVSGHVMAHGSAQSAYRAEATGPTTALADGDRLGRFRMRSLEAGRYTMVIGNGEIQVVLSADLGEVAS